MGILRKQEKQAWEALLTDVRHARRTYRHLLDRAHDEPEKVQLYLSTLTDEEINQDSLLRKLREIVSTQMGNRRIDLHSTREAGIDE